MSFTDWPTKRRACSNCRKVRACTKVGVHWLCVACVEILRRLQP